MNMVKMLVWIIINIFLECTLIISSESVESSDGLNVTEQWLMKLIPKHYNDREVPVQNGLPIKVKLLVRPWTIGKVSLQDMNFHVNLYVAMWWLDFRLNIPEYHNNTIVLPDTVAAKLWTPDVTFRNCMACEIVRFKHEIHKLLLMGNECFYFARMDARIFCNFHIGNYPMDSHLCNIEVQSAHAWMDELILVPNIDDHTFLRNTSLPQFAITDLSSGTCSKDLDKSGLYLSCLQYNMKFTRKIAFHVMLTYCPCILIVILSWISFWLDVDLAAPRVALGLTSILTLSTQFSNAQKDLPPVSYLKAIDVWFIVCMFMVFAALVEFAISYTLRKLEKKIPMSKPIHRIEPLSAVKPFQRLLSRTPKTTSQIDVWARIAFPVIFLVFNLCYWGYYGSK